MGFPKVEGFDIADRIYLSPFDKRAHAKANNQNYPDVEHRDDGIFVRSTIGALEPNNPVPALRSPLRMAVGPALQNRKIAILYTLYRHDQSIGEGRLKIQFGAVAD